MSDIGYDDETTALVVTSSPPTQRIKDGTTERTRITSIAVKCVAVMVVILAIVSLSSVIGGNDRSKTVGFDFSETALLRSEPVYDPTKDFCFKAGVNDWYCWDTNGALPEGDGWYPVDAPSSGDCGNRCTKFHVYDPNKDFCFQAYGHDWYCWHNKVVVPIGHWGMVIRDSGDCGNWCAKCSAQQDLICLM